MRTHCNSGSCMQAGAAWRNHEARVPNWRGNAKTLLPHQHGHSRKHEPSGSIVDHVNLAGVEAGLQLREWHIELEHRGLAARERDFLHFYQRSLVSLGITLEERNVAHHPPPGFGVLLRCPAVGFGCGLLRRVVHLVIKIKMLVGREQPGDAWYDLLSILH